MGEVKKEFCDGCKKELAAPTYSQGSEGGPVTYHTAVWQAGPGVEGVSAQLCDICFGKVKTWLAGKIKAAADDWGVDAPVAKTPTPPTL